tara:strand:+ start:18 stop:614 length:597 start_codon:yes stop_codon:yes gene_type:complete
MFFKEDYNSELINKFYSEIKKNNDFNIDETKVLWRNYKEIVMRLKTNDIEIEPITIKIEFKDLYKVYLYNANYEWKFQFEENPLDYKASIITETNSFKITQLDKISKIKEEIEKYKKQLDIISPYNSGFYGEEIEDNTSLKKLYNRVSEINKVLSEKKIEVENYEISIYNEEKLINEKITNYTILNSIKKVSDLLLGN